MRKSAVRGLASDFDRDAQAWPCRRARHLATPARLLRSDVRATLYRDLGAETPVREVERIVAEGHAHSTAPGSATMSA